MADINLQYDQGLIDVCTIFCILKPSIDRLLPSFVLLLNNRNEGGLKNSVVSSKNKASTFSYPRIAGASLARVQSLF